jgi:hypothetical protein
LTGIRKHPAGRQTEPFPLLSDLPEAWMISLDNRRVKEKKKGGPKWRGSLFFGQDLSAVTP